MWKLKDIFNNQKELPQWILPLIILVWLFMIITEYGHRPFVEGFMEDFTDPVLYYIFIGVGIVSIIIVYFIKRKQKNKVEDGEVDNSIQEESTSNGGMTIVVILWIFIIAMGYFSNRHSKETEESVEEFLKQKKMEQIDPHSQK